MRPISLMILAGCIALSGCSTSVNMVERADPQAMPTYVNDRRVVTDKSLDKALAILSVNEAQVSGDLLKIQVTVRNNSRSTKTFNYRFEWIGDDGMEINSPANTMRTLRIDGGEVRAISAVASSPRAVDFRLKLLEPRPF